MARTLQHLPFESVWKMRIDIPYSLFVRDGDLLWSTGQCPLNEMGEVLHPNDLFSQAQTVITFIDQFLTQLDCDASVIGELVVYYLKTAENDAQSLTEVFQRHYGSDIIVVPIGIPHFYYEGMMIEVDCFGSKRDKTFATYKDDNSAIELNVVDAGELKWVNILVPTGVNTIANITNLFIKARLDFGNCLSEQWFASSDKMDHQIESIRASRFQHSSPIVRKTSDTFMAIGNFMFVDKVISSRLYRMADHAIEGVEIKMAQSERHFEIEGMSVEKLDLVEQTRKIMCGIDQTLKAANLSFGDVRKSTTYYNAGSSAEELHDNMNVRNQYYTKPGPASTGVPVCSFSTSNSLITVRIFGCLPHPT